MLPPSQIIPELTVIVGLGFTLTEATAVLEHPEVDPMTEYDVEPVGETVVGLVVDPLLHV